MPPTRHTGRNRRPPPAGFSDIEDTLLEFSAALRDAEAAPSDGKKRHETLWPVFQITHQRSRYVYELYYEKEAISRALYEWLLKNGYADGNLIAKWKKQGYERLCCLRCIQTKETNFGSVCVCRVPRGDLAEEGGAAAADADEEEDEGKKKKKAPGKMSVQCVNCGCRGCASGD